MAVVLVGALLAALVATPGFAAESQSALPALTARFVGQRAAETSYAAAAARAGQRAADARVDETWVKFLPSLSGAASYTRWSDFTPPALFPFSLAATNTPAGSVNPATVSTGPIRIAPELDHYALEANLAVPLSDYFLKISPAYAAAKHEARAAKHDAMTARADAAIEARVTFYTWLRARSTIEVAQRVLHDRHARLLEVQQQLQQGTVSQSDELSMQAAVAEAEAALATSQAFVQVAERQLRTALHAEQAVLVPGENLTDPLPAPKQPLASLLHEALENRAELKALVESGDARRAMASATRSNVTPSLSAFGLARYMNPDPRYFPPSDVWLASFAVGVKLQWSPTEALLSSANARGDEARAEALQERTNLLRDAIVVEVTQAYEGIRAADSVVIASERQLSSAEEAYRVARALLNNGRATARMVSDAESEAIRARLAQINARVDARIARVRLERALGHAYAE